MRAGDASCQAFAVQCCAMSRKYELKRRAERQSETRHRIVAATVELHTSVGPARTTISAIADRAGVQRHTVYAHFPDEQRLFQACSTHWRELHPLPGQRQLGRTSPILHAGSARRCRMSTRGTSSSRTTSRSSVATRGSTSSRPSSSTGGSRRSGRCGAELADGWPRRKAVQAAIGHALDFETWRSLTRRQGLTRKQAVDAMLSFVASV